jgi:LCP family protein required for cell wall assembly
VVLVAVGSLAWVWYRFDSIHRLDLGDALVAKSGPAVNYLLVGSDSREGIDASTPNVGAIGTTVTGRRSDTIIVLRIQGGRATMMSIPRDLWATNVATGRTGRINAAYNDGPANLVRTVTANLGIPVHHYIEVDFVTFSEMVDAIGGIDIEFAHPAYDRNSGLNIIAPGVRHLDGSQALAYVRSRHYVEIVDGQERPDPTADLGRNQRQQNFIRTVLREVGATRNPWTLAKVVGAATTGMRVDTQLGFGDVVSLARNLSGTDPTSVVLPTHGARKGGASILLLDTEASRPVLAQFGGSPNAPR